MAKSGFIIHTHGDSCCLNCAHRTSGCHSSCEQHAAEIISGICLDADKEKDRKVYGNYVGFVRARLDRIQKYKRAHGRK